MLRFIYKYAIKFWWQIILLIALIILISQINLELPKLTSRMINEGVAMHDVLKIYTLGLKMVGLIIITGFIIVLSMFFSTRIAAGIAKNMRMDTFVKIESFSLSELSGFSISSLITRITNDTAQFQQTFSMLLRTGIYALIVGVGATINVLSISISMSWVLAGVIFFILTVVVIITTFAIPKLKEIQENIDSLNLQTRQSLNGIRIIRAFRNDKREEVKFARINKRNFKTNLFVDRIFGLVSPSLTMIYGLSSAAVVWLSAYFVDKSMLQVGDIFALIQYVGQVTSAFMMISVVFTYIPRMFVSIKRIREIQETDVTINDSEQNHKTPKKFDIRFDGVYFKHKNADGFVLEDLNFSIKQGETVVIIGGTGSGKSTVAKLIPRLFDITKGRITIGGVDISKMRQSELRNLISYAPQKVMLFSGSIRDNVSYGSNLDDDRIIESLKIAQAWNFIQKMPQKIDEKLSKDGKNFSGGQKQRLSIARAIAKNAPIMIFDDSFSALDFKTDSQLRHQLATKTNGKTKLIVAQRISSISQADKIIVLNEGKIVGVGTHNELLRENTFYREIALSQLSEGEVLAEIANKGKTHKGKI